MPPSLAVPIYGYGAEPEADSVGEGAHKDRIGGRLPVPERRLVVAPLVA